jgi:hypothetical protein
LPIILFGKLSEKKVQSRTRPNAKYALVQSQKEEFETTSTRCTSKDKFLQIKHQQLGVVKEQIEKFEDSKINILMDKHTLVRICVGIIAEDNLPFRTLDSPKVYTKFLTFFCHRAKLKIDLNFFSKP